MRIQTKRSVLPGVVAFSFFGAAHAATFTVTTAQDNVPTSVCPSTSALQPCTLRQAIITANGSAGRDTIGFEGNLTIVVQSDLPAITEQVDITATAAQTVIVDGGSARALFRIVTSGNGDYIFRGFTIRNGRAVATGFPNGGGIHFDPNALSSLRLESMTLNGNQAATGDGGGLWIDERGRVTIVDSNFQNNTANGAGRFGGAIFNNGGQLTISGGSFSGNGAAAAGGAIYNLNGALSINFPQDASGAATTFSGNTQTAASRGGGAIFTELATTGSTRLNRGVFIGNTASGAGSSEDTAGLGGAMFVSNALNDSSLVSISNAIFKANSAAYGGAIAVKRGGVNLDTVTFGQNSASRDGGAVYLGFDAPNSAGGAMHLRSCTIASNSAGGFGGGIGNNAQSADGDVSSMVHCTVALNNAADGGGIGLRSAPDKEFPGIAGAPFTSNIIGGNTATLAAGSDCQAPFAHSTPTFSGFNLSVTNCGFGTASTGADVVRIGTLAERSPTSARIDGTAMETVNILVGSAAIDAANQTAGMVTTTDQRGAPAADGDQDANSSKLRDIGAYEFAGYGAVEFVTATSNIPETQTSLQLFVKRFGDIDGAATTVDYSTTDGSAKTAASGSDPADYSDTSGTLIFPQGSPVQQSFTIPLQDDDVVEAPDPQVFFAGLDATNKEADFGAKAAHTINIADVERGVISFVGPYPYSVTTSEGLLMVQLTLQRTGGRNGAVSVNYTTQSGGGPAGTDGATLGVDYSAGSGSVSWADNEDGAKTLTLVVLNDSDYERTEYFTVTLDSTGGGARLGSVTPDNTRRALVRIDDNDTAVPGTIRLKSASFSGSEATGQAVITVVRENGDDQQVTVQYATGTSGTATTGSDYSTSSGTVTWNHGESGDKTFTIAVANDTLAEADEDFAVEISSPANVDDAASPPTLGTPASANVVIESDEKALFRFNPASYTATEAGGSVTISVEPLQTVSGGPVRITLATADGTAQSSSDYTALAAPGNQLVFNHGDNAAKTLTIPISSDGQIEETESFDVRMLSLSGGGAVSGSDTATVTITGDSIIRFVNAGYSSLTEAGTITAAVERIGPNATAASVQYSIMAGTATQGTDYTTPSGSFSGVINCAAGSASCDSITINVLGDSEIEEDEGISLSLSNPVNAVLQPGRSTATATILDDDFRFLLDAASYSAVEGTASGSKVTVTVRRVGTNRGAATVGYADTAGSATRNTDYAQSSGSLSFADGGASPRAEQTQTVELQFIPDEIDESDETFSFALSAPSAPGQLGTPASATVTIQDDDDAAILLSKTALILSEGGAGDSYTVVLATQPTAVVTVTVSVPSAQATTDPTTLSFSPASSSPQRWDIPQTVTVSAVNDAAIEGDHAAIISNAASGSDSVYSGLVAVEANATIADNDSAVRFSSASFNVAEGSGTATLSAERIGALVGTSSVSFATADGTATAPGDYTATSGQLDWADGEGGAKTFTVTIGNDQRVEPAETVQLTLSSPVGGSGGDTQLGTPSAATLTISDDGDTAGITLTQSGGSTAVTEGGATDSYTIVLTSEPSADVTITLSGDAQAGASPATLTFTPANFALPQTVTVAAVNDTAIEGTHSGTISHSVASGDSAYQGAGLASVVAAIADNDSAVRFTGTSFSVMEGSATANVTVERIGAGVGAVSVDFASSDGSASAGADYTQALGTLNWNEGETGVRNIAVTIAQDLIAEGNETLTLSLSNAVNANPQGQTALASPGAATLTIVDDDQPGILVSESGGSTRATEGGAADSLALVVATQPRGNVSIRLTPDAQLDADPVQLLFTPENWNTAQTVAIAAVDDREDEGEHSGGITFAVTSSDVAYSGMNLPALSVAIADNDAVAAPAGSGGGGGGALGWLTLLGLGAGLGLRRRIPGR